MISQSAANRTSCSTTGVKPASGTTAICCSTIHRKSPVQQQQEIVQQSATQARGLSIEDLERELDKNEDFTVPVDEYTQSAIEAAESAVTVAPAYHSSAQLLLNKSTFNSMAVQQTTPVASQSVTPQSTTSGLFRK